MRMSTKSRSAVDAMIDLALRQASGPVALATISARLRVSLSYLEQLFSRLRRQGLIESTRGPGGGYTLAMAAERITVAAIVEAVDDDSAAGPAGPHDALWQSLDRVMREHLATVTLQSLVDGQLAAGVRVPEPTAARRLLAPAVAPRRIPSAVPNSVFAFGQSFRSS